MILVISINALITILLIVSVSYLKEKGKNYATKEDVGQITQTIEKIKNAFEIEKQKLMLALSSQSATYHAADNKRVDAVEKTWTAFISMKNISVKELFLYLEILLESEYESVLLKIKNKESVIEKLEKDMDELHRNGEEVDAARPFINESLYAMFFSFRAIRGRAAFLLRKSLETGKVTLWSRDKHTIGLMKTVLSEEEIEAINKTSIGKFGVLKMFYYGKALTEMNKILSGQSAMESSIENARRILETAIDSDTELSKERIK